MLDSRTYKIYGFQVLRATFDQCLVLGNEFFGKVVLNIEDKHSIGYTVHATIIRPNLKETYGGLI
jgi:hypothetical protein